MRASSVTPKPVDWLWWPYVPLGKLTAVAGQIGQAKSLFSVWLAAATSRGAGIHHARPSGVLMLNAEDDAADTIRPRLEAAGADLDRVWIEPSVTLDAVHLDALCDELGDVRLITIDPIQAYLPGSVNSWKGQDVRMALEPIRQLAADRRIAVLLVQHLNRRADAGEPLARIADSQGIPQLARSVLIWGPDPSDPAGDHGATKVLTRAKGNLARAKDSATFTIIEKKVAGGIAAPALVRGDDREITPEDVVADRETRSAVDEAVEWLRTVLADGPLPAKEGQRQAREVGIAERTLKRARRLAGVTSESTRNDAGIAGWTWRLEDSIDDDGPLGPLGTLGLVGQTKGAKEANKAKSSNTLAVGLASTGHHPNDARADRDRVQCGGESPERNPCESRRCAGKACGKGGSTGSDLEFVFGPYVRPNA